MNLIYLLPVGSTEDEVLTVLEQKLHQLLDWEIRRGVQMQMPSTAFNAVRKQYEALQVIRAMVEATPNDATRVALMSLARLRQEFYGLPANKELMMTRAVKEALHELGHTFGLVHCPTSPCVMTLANDIQHVDEKESEFCSGCAVLLRNARHALEINAEKETL
jgi:archaemetzincin